MPYYLKNATWKKLFYALQTTPGIHLTNERQVRRFIDGVLYVCRSGCQWRLLPWTYGKWRTVHARFKSWARRGIWRRLFEALQDDPDTEAVMIDATIVRAHSCAAGYGDQEEQGLGRSKGGFSSKIHAVVDALGNPLKFSLTGGQRNDITQAPQLLEEFSHAWVIADKGYDSDPLVMQIIAQQCTPVIPPRKGRKNSRKYDAHWYRERHLVECFFGKMKHFRRVFSRFDKTAEAFLSFLYLTGTLLWLK
jgi:transposase